MTKYIINGKEIEKPEPSRFVGSGMGVQRLAMQLNDLLEALDEKKEEKIRELEGKRVSYPRDEKREKMAQDANYKNMPEYGEFWRNVKRSSIEEPKSTLREATLKIVRTVADLQAEPVADKIISLFKDTLLKEIEKVRNNYVMYEIEPYEKDIINLIKNL